MSTMAFKVLLVHLAISMLLTSGTERSKEVSTRGRRLCLCSDRVFRISSQDSEASSSASCEEMCTFNSNTGVLFSFTHRHLRSRRDVLEDAKNCCFNKIHHTWQVYNTKVAFHRSGSSSEWFAEVSWSPFNGTSLLWIGYYIIYFTGISRGDHPLKCHIISKNQTSVNISSTEDDQRIILRVIALPKSLNSTSHSSTKVIQLDEYADEKPKFLGFTPPGLDVEPFTEATTPRLPPIFPRLSSDVPTKLIAAIVGAAFAFLLLVFAVLCYRKQINSSWPFSTCFGGTRYQLGRTRLDSERIQADTLAA